MFDGGYRQRTLAFVRSSGQAALTSQTNSVLKLATYNVWFGEIGFRRRAQALCDILGDEDLDLIALQEVTPEFLAILQSQSWASHYLFSTTDDAKVRPYGNLLLSRAENSTFERVSLWSYQARHINLVHLPSGHCIGTVHLESQRHNEEIRCTQLSDIFSTLDVRLTLLVGDFNFDDGSKEESLRPAEFVDAWTQLHLAAQGPTFDTKANGMTRDQAGREKQVRFDRIWVRKSAAIIVEIRRIGLTSIPDHKRLWPSDHFGLVASLSLLEIDQSEEKY